MSSVFCPYTDATTVEHAVSAFFVSRHEINLIVAKKNILQIYRFVQWEEDLTSGLTSKDEDIADLTNEDDFLGGGMKIRASERQIVTKLVLVLEYRLFGTITSLCTVRAEGFEESGLEHILVAFETAKASLLRWDQDLNTVITVSLHSFERDEFRSPLSEAVSSSMKIDPLSRVATLSFNGDHLAFLPIAQKDELLIEDAEEDQHAHGPIAKSFVISIAQLEDNITHLIDFTFVDGYREPALAILYSTEGTTSSLQRSWRKDTCKMVVLTLDIQAGARTAIFEISDLPSDLQSISMVPDPIGGCLLVGANEIVYVDPASRVVALAVNAFAKGASDMPMRDYSQLNLHLEGAVAVPLQDGESLDGILLVLADGKLGLLTLNLDGRTVSSLHLKVVTEEFGGKLLLTGISCATVLTGKRMFVGSRTGDNKLLAWRKKARAASSNDANDQIMQDAILDVKDEEPDYNDDLEELYGDDTTEKKLFGAETTTFDMRFYLHDTMRNQGPITGMAIGTPDVSETDDRQEGVGAAGEIAVVGGPGRAGNLTLYRRSITPEVIGKFDSPEWQALWTVKIKSKTTELDDTVNNALDTYLMASKDSETQVFTIDTAFVEKTDSEFETSDSTVSVGTIMDHSCIVQICPDMMRTYDAELKLLEMKPTPEECTIVSASIVDPYVLLVLDNAKVALYLSNYKTKELEEIEHEMNGGSGIACATLYVPQDDQSLIFQELITTQHNSKKRKRDQVANSLDHANSSGPCVCFTMTANGHLAVYDLLTMTLIFRCEDAARCPEVLISDLGISSTNGHTKSSSASKQRIVEIAVVDLGQHVRSTHLVFRTSKNDIITYRPYTDSEGKLRFSKVPGSLITRPIADNTPLDDGEDHKASIIVQKPEMVACENVGGFACLFVKTGCYWLICTDQSLPTLHPAGHVGVRSLSGFNTLDAGNGFIYCDADSIIRICKLPTGFDFSGKWSSKTIRIGRSVHAIAYYATQQVYAILTSTETEFEIPDEEDEAWQPRQDNREKLPLLARGSIELIDANTHQVIDRYELAPNEQGLCLKAITLTVATEYTKKKRPCLAVSTGILRGEDLAMRGAVYVFDVVEVVPEVGQPDSKYRLKSVCREEVRAAATTLAEVEGYLLSSQGQKVVVRSLEEDERLTPVAFVDLGLATTTAKCLRSMILFGDVQKGVRFVGFGEEPYKITNFGRDYEDMDVLDAEFMIDGKALYFAASDAAGNLRVLQYDPENSTTLAGSRLIRRSDMHTGSVISSMVLLPDISSNKNEDRLDPERSLVLCASLEGAIGALIPITERSYRRLYTVQAQLASTECQVAGLNPRAYRLCTAEGLTTNSARGILDGQLLLMFTDVDTVSQAQLAQKSGVGVDNVISDLRHLQHIMGNF